MPFPVAYEHPDGCFGRVFRRFGGGKIPSVQGPTVFGRYVADSQNGFELSASACGNCCLLVTDKTCLKVAMWVL